MKIIVFIEINKETFPFHNFNKNIKKYKKKKKLITLNKSTNVYKKARHQYFHFSQKKLCFMYLYKIKNITINKQIIFIQKFSIFILIQNTQIKIYWRMHIKTNVCL